ncbi:MAG: 6-pyruvoyl trahydropterin synthase family protein [Candidatus Nitrospinota bacterium M3_3B_026]
MRHGARIRVSRQENQFAAAHFLVDMGKCERLHGHNYSVTVEIGGRTGPDHTLIDFNFLNTLIARVVSSLDHKTLIAGAGAADLEVGDREVEARFKGKRYVFPKEDVVILDVEAATAEKLAEYIAGLLCAELAGRENLEWIEVGVSEGPAQTAFHRRELEG